MRHGRLRQGVQRTLRAAFTAIRAAPLVSCEIGWVRVELDHRGEQGGQVLAVGGPGNTFWSSLDFRVVRGAVQGHIPWCCLGRFSLRANLVGGFRYGRSGLLRSCIGSGSCVHRGEHGRHSVCDGGWLLRISESAGFLLKQLAWLLLPEGHLCMPAAWVFTAVTNWQIGCQILSGAVSGWLAGEPDM